MCKTGCKVRRASIIAAAAALLSCSSPSIAAQTGAPQGGAIEWVPASVAGQAAAVPKRWRVEVKEGGLYAREGGGGDGCFYALTALGTPEAGELPRAIDLADRMIPAGVSAHILRRGELDGGRASEAAELETGEGRTFWAVEVQLSAAPGGQVQISIATFSTSNRSQFASFEAQDALATFMASYGAAGEEPPLAGNWEAIDGGATLDVFRGGTWSGTITDGWSLGLDIGPGDAYRLTRVISSSGPIVAGLAASIESGTYRIAGGVVTLRRRSCVVRTLDKRGATGTERCSSGPVVLRVYPGEKPGELTVRGSDLRLSAPYSMTLGLRRSTAAGR